MADGGRIEIPSPRHATPGDLHPQEHAAITAQARQLLDQLPAIFGPDMCPPVNGCADCDWARAAAALLREVARG
jgi:hypothetical protein